MMVQIVPHKWLTENNKKCAWSSYTNQIKINKSIFKRIPSSDYWPLYNALLVVVVSNIIYRLSPCEII